MIQGSCGPAWNSTSRPPAPHASMLMNARTLRAHLRRQATSRSTASDGRAGARGPVGPSYTPNPNSG